MVNYTGKDKEKEKKSSTEVPQTTGTQGGFSYGQYAPSDTVKQAQTLLKSQLAQKPGEYVSPWQNQLSGAMNDIVNRKPFQYDLNGDALYQQYKDRYIQQGRMAMMDTMGQAAGLTGGYGNSYAQQVGQQAYQGYLQGLNDKVPELYRLALDKYQSEGQDLYNRYSLLAGQDEQAYGRHRDKVSDYYTELQRLTDDQRYQAEQDYARYVDAYNRVYGQHRDAVGDSQWQQSFDYQKDRDAVGDAQWWESFGYQKDRDAVGDRQWQDSFDYQKVQNAIANQQWQQSFGYQKERDAVEDGHWWDSYNYQKDRDAVSDEQWKQNYEFAKAQYENEKGPLPGLGGDDDEETQKTEEPTIDEDKPSGDFRPGEIASPGTNTLEELAEYLDDMVAKGRMTEEEADRVYAEQYHYYQ